MTVLFPRPGGEVTRTKVLDAMAEPRRAMLTALKARGPLTINELAAEIGITYEAVRQHLGLLELEGWIDRRLLRDACSRGRPRSVYLLTNAGDHLFPKEYEDLAVALLDAAADRLGPEALHALLEDMVRRKVEIWEPRLEGRTLEERVRALQGIYLADDPFCRTEMGKSGGLQLVEMNCPFLEVAQRRPALCSVTVSVLRRLLSHEVVRAERFQTGHGRCVFQVLGDVTAEAGAPLLVWEPPAADSGAEARGEQPDESGAPGRGEQRFEVLVGERGRG